MSCTIEPIFYGLEAGSFGITNIRSLITNFAELQEKRLVNETLINYSGVLENLCIVSFFGMSKVFQMYLPIG